MINQSKEQLNDIQKNHIEFLLRLFCFDDKLKVMIKNSSQSYPKDIVIEDGYIINYKIIECFYNFYNANFLRNLFSPNGCLYNIFLKYEKNNYYINESYIDNFTKEILELLPKDYIKQIRGKNDLGLSTELNDVQSYLQTFKYHSNQQQFYYFEHTILISRYLGNIILKKFSQKNIKFYQVEYMVAYEKLYLIYNLNIYYGYLNDKGIYIPEILFCCSKQNEMTQLKEDLKTSQIHVILQNTKRIDNNIPEIGKYKDTNTKIIVLKGHYFIKQKKEIKNEIENLIKIIIDQKKIIRNIQIPLNKNRKYKIYYVIDYQWLLNYLEYYKLNNLYYDQNIHITLQNIFVNSPVHLTNEEILENAKQMTEFANMLYNYSNLISPSNNQFNTPKIPKRININDIFYFNKFFLVSENTMKSLSNNYIQNQSFFYFYFGDNKIFISYNGKTKFFISIYFLGNDNYIYPELFYKFNGKKEFSDSLNLLLEKGFTLYNQHHIMFNEDKNNIDYASPIFDQNNKEIGYAFKYSPNIKDYSPYIINDEYKTAIKLYFNYAKFHSKSIKFKNGNYFCLINTELLKKYKEHYDYYTLEKYLKQNKITQQISNNINQNIEYNLDDKMMSLIFKNLPNNLNQFFIEKSKIKISGVNDGPEPKLKGDEFSGIVFYDEFEIIDNDLYYSIFKNAKIKITGECYFTNNKLCIQLPKQLNNRNSSSVLFLYGSLNNNHIFKARYILEYYSEIIFKNNFNLAEGNSGFDRYVESFKFLDSNKDILIDIDNNHIGFIYDLFYKPKPFPRNLLPKLGLANIGATCYMNATLRSLAQIEKLVYYFKNKQNIQTIDYSIAKCKQNKKDSLTESFKILIDNLWPEFYNSNLKKNNNNYYYEPFDFKSKISSMNSLFQGVQANDAKDLVNFIIMTLHEELNIKQKQNFINNNLNINQTNQQMVFQNFYNSFYGENKSIISEIFYGISHTDTKCSNCNYNKHNFEAYFFLNFPLEEVRKYKLQELIKRNLYITNLNQNMINQNMMNMKENLMQLNQEFQKNLNKIGLLQNNLVDIVDCFYYNQKIENFVGENAMYCDICKATLPASFQTKLYSAPEVLIIVLNRGVGIQFKVKLQFNLQINLSDFLEDKNSGCLYELIGVVTHMGESGGAGHFIATCKSPVDNNWYQYNDDLVFPVTDFNNQLFNYAMPYILFFKKNVLNNNIQNNIQMVPNNNMQNNMQFIQNNNFKNNIIMQNNIQMITNNNMQNNIQNNIQMVPNNGMQNNMQIVPNNMQNNFQIVPNSMPNNMQIFPNNGMQNNNNGQFN